MPAEDSILYPFALHAPSEPPPARPSASDEETLTEITRLCRRRGCAATVYSRTTPDGVLRTYGPDGYPVGRVA